MKIKNLKLKIDQYNPSEIEAMWPHSAKASRGKQAVYKPSEIEQKWQRIWEKERIYSPDLDASASLSTKKPFGKAQGLRPFYNLMMFPYPSAEGMHVGNMYAFTGSDVYGRFQRMQGKTVFEPIGLDGFGIHSENYAIKVGTHPVEQAKISEKNFYRQLKSIGNSFDWTRTVETYKPEFYKWTQWIFIQLFKAGLAYRKKAPVNFCPSCKTVLSDEQVIEGKCERCESEVVKRDLEQWFFKITKYADRLLNGLTQIDWSEKVKTAQRQWIGKSEGALIKFKIKDSDKEVEVFTTRPDTLFGATFLVLSPEHPLVSILLEKQSNFARRPPAKLKGYVEEAKKKTDQDRLAEGKEKTGVFTEIYAINPVNQEEIPVWIADFVIGSYGTGAVFADAHDERDFEFAKKYKIALKPTLKTGNKKLDEKIKNLEECFTGDGILVDSGEFTGLTSAEARKKITAWLGEKGSAKAQVNYHLRDWLISRQRYWGPPIPMIYCVKCDWQPVPEDQLPVELPFIKDYKPLGIHSTSSGQAAQAPLASHPEFYRCKCPKCGGEAKRETDVSDTFLDSSWYFLRYLATECDDIPFPMKNSKFEAPNSKQYQNPNVQNSKQFRISDFDIRAFTQRAAWLPVNMYIGGAEHSVLHLLYSRFITMALHDLGLISFEEPFTQFRAHGLIVKDGAKMSKSKGNVVIPDAYIKKFGADSLRAYLMFMGPFSQGGDFRDTGIEGMSRFLKRIWSLVVSHLSLVKDQRPKTKGQMQMMHKTIKKVTEDISNLSYNTSIAALMEWYNYLSEKLKVKSEKLTKEEVETFIKLLAPFAPHVSEELFSLINADKNQRMPANNNWQSIHLSAWPVYDPKFLVKDEVIIVVQVNGKLRGSIKIKNEKLKMRNYVEDLAKKDSNVAKYLEAKEIKKVIYVEGKVINFVVT